MVTNGPMEKMLGGQKFASDMVEVQWAVCQSLAQQPTSFFYWSFTNLLKDGTNV